MLNESPQVLLYLSKNNSEEVMSQPDNSKLFATAATAAVAGAALAVAAMKITERLDGSKKDSDLHIRPKRSSFLINDPSEPVRGQLERVNSETLLFPHQHEEKMRRRIATRYTIEEENNTPRTSVTVRVPATSANVGPGCKFFILLVIVVVCFFPNTFVS